MIVSINHRSSARRGGAVSVTHTHTPTVHSSQFIARAQSARHTTTGPEATFVSGTHQHHNEHYLSSSPNSGHHSLTRAMYFAIPVLVPSTFRCSPCNHRLDASCKLFATAAALAHEYHFVWEPPAPDAPPRLILCSSKGTFSKVRYSLSAVRGGGGRGSGAAAEERKSDWRSSLPVNEGQGQGRGVNESGGKEERLALVLACESEAIRSNQTQSEAIRSMPRSCGMRRSTAMPRLSIMSQAAVSSLRSETCQKRQLGESVGGRSVAVGGAGGRSQSVAAGGCRWVSQTRIARTPRSRRRLKLSQTASCFGWPTCNQKALRSNQQALRSNQQALRSNQQ